MNVRRKIARAKYRLAFRRGIAALGQFRRDDSGVMAKPFVMFFLSMVAVGGMGVDLMRRERDRTILQYTLDRAVLAAADLDQQLEPTIVVQDYLNKAGLGEYYETPVVETGLGFKKVQSTIDTTFQTHLMKFAGGSDLPLFATSRAEESIDGLEISLVLDVSGSMNSNSRLTNLKSAARDFIDTMVANTTDGKMSISIIPYATQVSAPDDFFGHFNTSGENNFANCINFTGSDFTSTAMSTSTSYDRTMHFSPWSGSDYRSSGNPIGSEVCDDRSSREMLLFQKDATVLKNYITNLSAWGNTSIDLGMKWGAALLDPSLSTVINTLSGSSIPSDFSARPAAYSDTDTIKIVVLMTDGQNTSQYYIEDDHRSGNSNVWYSAPYNRYSTYNPSYGKYWRDGYSYWYNTPYDSTNAQRLSYADLFAHTSLKYLYKYIYGDWMGTTAARNEWYYGVYDYYGRTTKDARTRSICQAAKDQGVIVYTIGFEAPSGGVAVLQDCASSDAHYFDVQGLEISDAFSSIATSIRQLRLTQ